MFRNYRKCYCMNNSYKNDSCEMQQDIIENQCDNVVSYEEYNDGCSCGFDEEYNVFPENPMLAQSYVPFQYMDKTFKPCVGLKMGTIFSFSHSQLQLQLQFLFSSIDIYYTPSQSHLIPL